MVVIRMLLGLACLAAAGYAGFFAYVCLSFASLGYTSSLSISGVTIPSGVIVVAFVMIAIGFLVAAWFAFSSSRAGDSKD